MFKYLSLALVVGSAQAFTPRDLAVHLHADDFAIFVSESDVLCKDTLSFLQKLWSAEDPADVAGAQDRLGKLHEYRKNILNTGVLTEACRTVQDELETEISRIIALKRALEERAEASSGL